MITKLIVSRDLADLYIDEFDMKEDDFIIADPMKEYPEKKKKTTNKSAMAYGSGQQLRGQRKK